MAHTACLVQKTDAGRSEKRAFSDEDRNRRRFLICFSNDLLDNFTIAIAGVYAKPSMALLSRRREEISRGR